MEGSKTGREYPRTPVPGVAAIIMSEGSVLLVKRGNEPSKGKWGLPGGVVELGEKIEDAVVREVLEETGLKVRPKRLVTVYDSIFKDDAGKIRFHYVLSEYLCEVVEGSIKATSDALDAKWIPLEELEELEITQGTKRIIDESQKA